MRRMVPPASALIWALAGFAAGSLLMFWIFTD
jgi:hypothetical protein